MSETSNYLPGCGCFECDETRRSVLFETGHMTFAEYAARLMIVCPKCGNKRCPKATHHDNPCTGSNEPNQDGSRYQTAASPVPSLGAGGPVGGGE